MARRHLDVFDGRAWPGCGVGPALEYWRLILIEVEIGLDVRRNDGRVGTERVDRDRVDSGQDTDRHALLVKQVGQLDGGLASGTEADDVERFARHPDGQSEGERELKILGVGHEQYRLAGVL